MAADNKLLG